MQSVPVPVSFSGSIPQNYDAFLGPMYFEPYAADLARRVKKLNPKKILELAAGTGRVTKVLFEAMPGIPITATDINPDMVRFGKTRVPGADWKEADAQSLPFEDAQFDCIVVQFGVMFYSDRVGAFREAYRVLKSGGTFLFNSWNEMRTNRPTLLAQNTLEHFFPSDTPAFFHVPYSYHNEEQIRSDLESAGFENITIQLVKLTGPSRTAEEAAKGLLQGTPVFTAIQERDAGKLPAMIEQLTAQLAREFGENNLQIPLQAWVAEVRK